MTIFQPRGHFGHFWWPTKLTSGLDLVVTTMRYTNRRILYFTL